MNDTRTFSIKSNAKKTVAFILLAASILSISSCSLFKRTPEQIEAANKEAMQMFEEKADKYGLSTDNVEVLEGGNYFKVLIEPPKSVEDMEELIVYTRKWLRFGYAELGKRYDIVFYDKNMPDISYWGISDQDFGYPTEYLWSDYNLVLGFIGKIHLLTSPDYKKNPTTPEEFYKNTGIDEELADELNHWLSSTFYVTSGPDIVKEDHDIAFIPGDTIMHYEIFTVGEKDSPFEPGTYTVDLTGRYDVIHITDSDDNTKYRLYLPYSDGHEDALYEYSALPATVELEEGDIIYMTNAHATFDKVGD